MAKKIIYTAHCPRSVLLRQNIRRRKVIKRSAWAEERTGKEARLAFENKTLLNKEKKRAKFSQRKRSQEK